MSQSSLSLFVCSAIITLGMTKLASLKLSSIDKSYMATLSKLFKAIKTKSRHNENQSLSTGQIFEERKKCFKQIFSNAGLNESSQKIIHVTGTKGKGSTVEYISSAIRKEGCIVGTFTSPHLHTARERIKVGKSMISKEDIIVLGNQVIDYMQHYSWTVFFDLLLALALDYFGKQPHMDYIILEAGIGGRYDSTNFIDNPIAIIITSISLDHQAILGDTIEEIAYQKAGIIKKNCHVFTPADQPITVLEVLRKQSLELNATLHEIENNSVETHGLGIQTPYRVQLQNACLSRAVVTHLGLSSKGMKDFYWPCRMDTFVLTGTTLVLDGCHNGESVQSFLTSLRSIHLQPPPSSPAELLVLFGAGAEKCVCDMLGHVFTAADKVLFVQSKHFKALAESDLVDMVSTSHPDLLAKLVNSRSPNSRTLASISKYAAEVEDLDCETSSERVADGTIRSRLDWALEYSHKRQSEGVKVVVAVCGSLFAAAEAREEVYRLSPSLFAKDDWVRQCDPPSL